MSNEPFPIVTPFNYTVQPSVLICADSEAGMARAAEAVLAVGARTTVSLRIIEAVAVIDGHPPPHAAIIDVTRDEGDALDRLLDRLNLAASDGQYGSVVMVVPELIDLIMARAPHESVRVLCGASSIERAAELGVLLAIRTPPTHREGGVEVPVQLRQLSEEVGRIARALAQLSQAEHPAETRFRPDSAPPLVDPAAVMPSIASVRALIRARRLRDQFFAGDLFADPAWDMLLDLLLARLEGRLVAVSSLCIAAAVPPTTALRWIKRLTDEGLFVRTADPRDGRRVFIDLAEHTAQAMIAYLRGLPRLGVVLG